MTDHASLQVSPKEGFLRVVTSFAEATGKALGLGKAEALALTLSAEEVFTHLCRVVPPEGERVEVRCSEKGYCVQVDFLFPAVDFDMRTFNITTTVSLRDEADFDRMGLLLASRSVDRFLMAKENGRRLRLSLVKEKVYPPVEVGRPLEAKPLETFFLKIPDAEELKLFAELVATAFDERDLPDFFGYPGKLADMVRGGGYRAVLAMGSGGEIGGGALWHWIGSRSVEWLGPYTFSQRDGSPMPKALLERCIADVARTPAVALVSRFPVPGLSLESFEYLGSLRVRSPDGTSFFREARARLLQEDPGSVTWAHPTMEEFLRGEYRRLVLPREVRVVKDRGEGHSPHAVLFTAFDRPRGSVFLEPVWFGEDFLQVLGQHLDLFRREGMLNVFFHMDAGCSWQASFAPGLLANGLEPRYVLPYGGEGDVVVFQLDPEREGGKDS